MLDVTSNDMRPLRAFFGEHIRFTSVQGDRSRVTLLPGALPHLARYEGNPAFKRFLLNAISNPRTHYHGLTEVQRAYQRDLAQTRRRGYRYRHPALGWVVVDDQGTAQLMHPPRAHFAEAMDEVVGSAVTVAVALVMCIPVTFLDDILAIGLGTASERAGERLARSRSTRTIGIVLRVGGRAIKIFFATFGMILNIPAYLVCLRSALNTNVELVGYLESDP